MWPDTLPHAALYGLWYTSRMIDHERSPCKWNLHGVGHTQPLLVARFGIKLFHIALVVLPGVLVVAEQIVVAVVELMDEDGEIMHVVFGKQITHAWVEAACTAS